MDEGDCQWRVRSCLWPVTTEREAERECPNLVSSKSYGGWIQPRTDWPGTLGVVVQLIWSVLSRREANEYINN